MEDKNLSSPPSFAVDPRIPKAPEPVAPVEDERSLISAAIDETWAISDGEDISSFFKEYIPDESFKPDLMTLDDSYDNDQLEAFNEAVSEEHWDDLKAEFDETNRRTEFLAEQGWTGAGVTLGAAILDPTMLAAAATFEVGGFALIGAKAARSARIARALVAAGLAEATVAGIRSKTTNDYSEKDAAFDMLAALAITGGLEVAFGKNATDLVREAGDAEARQIIEEHSAGAAETRYEVESWRYDDYARRMKSGNSAVAEFAQTHMQDAVRGGSDSTAVKAERLRGHYLGRMNASFEELWRSHKKATNGGSKINEMQNARERAVLSEKVWEARVMGVDHGPEVRKVADEWGAQYDKMLAEAEDAGLAGFTRDMSNPTYMKQEWDRAAWSRAQKELDQDEFVELINKGLYGFDEENVLDLIELKKTELKEVMANSQVVREGTGEGLEAAVKKELAELESIRDARTKLAIGFTNRMLHKADGEARPLDQLLEDEDSLVKWLRESEDYEHLSEAEVKAFVAKAFKTKSKGGDVIDRAKKRIQIDPKASIMTRKGKEFRVADLLNRDAFHLHQSYIHSMTGHIAFAQNGIKKPSEWKELLNDVYTKELKKPGATDTKAKEMVKAIENDRREIFGLPRYDTSNHAGNRIASLLMKWNFTTAMGKAAFSAMSEMGRILGENGVRNTLRTISALDGLFTDSLRTINKGKHIVSEVNGFNASVGDEYLHRLFNSFDETGVLEGTFTSGFLTKAELVAHRGAQLMAKASLLAPVDKALRLLSFSSATNNMYGHLVKGKGSRLAFEQMGLTKPELDAIAENMRKYTKVSKLGHVEKLGIENWDRATADRFMDAMTTNGARQVQKALAGEGTAITSHPVGRIFLQFRKFAIDSYSKHLRADLRDLKHQPVRVMLSTMYATIFAGIGYYSRVQVSAAGMSDSDRKEYLADKFKEERLRANILNYTPNLGAFTTAWNMGPGMLDDRLEIPVYRSTGLTNKDISSNPTSDKINILHGLLSNVADSDPDKFVSKSRPFIPFQNTVPGGLLLNTAERLTE